MYCIGFFSSLRAELDRRGIELTLAEGHSIGIDRYKSDEGKLDWAIRRKNRCWRPGRKVLVWQPILDLVKGQDLVIVEQASKLLLNYWLIASERLAKSPVVALSGNGANLSRVHFRNGHERFHAVAITCSHAEYASCWRTMLFCRILSDSASSS